jgi:hypothetical protein
LAFLCCFATAQGKVHHSSDLGWMAGQVIAADFAALFRQETGDASADFVFGPR